MPQDLDERYGRPLIVVNLVKSQEKQKRETILKDEFDTAIAFLNSHILDKDKQIDYIAWDYKEHMKKDVRAFLKEIEPMVCAAQVCCVDCGAKNATIACCCCCY